MIHQWQTKHGLLNEEAAKALGCHISLVNQMRSGACKISRRSQLLMDSYDREHKSPLMSST